MNYILPLGLIVLMAWALGKSLNSFSELFASRRNKQLEIKKSATLPLMLQQLELVLEFMSPQAALRAFATLQNFRLRHWRANLMGACFAPLAVVFAWFALSLWMQVNATMVLTVGALIWLVTRPLFEAGRHLGLAVMFLGLFLLLGEPTLRLLSSWTMGGTPEILMWLADSRWPTLLVLLLSGVVIGFLTRMEFLILSFALVGVGAGVLSVSAAAVLCFGERLSSAVALVWDSRKLSKSNKQLARGIGLGAAIGFLPSFLLMGFVRDAMGPVTTFGMEGFEERLSMMLLLLVTLEIPVSLVTLVWGHFAALKVPEDLFESHYISVKWMSLSPVPRSFWNSALHGLRKRLVQLKGLRSQMNDKEWSQVPPAIREASAMEAEIVEDRLREYETHLLSR